MKLQILVPQYDETDEIIRPLLTSLAIQQNVNMEDIGVIIVNDGSETFLSDEFLDSFPYEIKYFKELHRGVSAARNSCLDHATADYIMFCDADDMFYNACGLYIIFREFEKGFDSLVSVFLEETVDQNTNPVYINHDIDSTFVHGKVHRRQFLIDENIRWDETLQIHEDSYFNCLCQRLAKELKYCPTSFYLWKWRKESVCRHDPKYILKTFNNMLDSNTALVKQFLCRERKEDARFFVVSMVYDSYFTLNKKEWINQENKEYRDSVEERFKDYFREFESLFNESSEQERFQIVQGIKNRMFQEGLLLESITFDDWIKKIKGGE